MSQGAAQGEGRQPTEEEVRAYLAQLRQADIAEIVAQAFSVLASGAEVKLGRRDARVLIDTAAGVLEVTKAQMDERLVAQMETAVNQLRLAQVDAEKQLAQMRAEGQIPDEEAGDLGSAPADADAAEGASDGGEPPDDPTSPPSSSRLWVPGR